MSKNVLDKPSAEGKSRRVCTMPRRENDYYEEMISCLCRVFAVVLPCVFLRLRKRIQSGGRAKAERRHSGKTRTKLGNSRPFPSAKIARNNDITNFFEQIGRIAGEGVAGYGEMGSSTRFRKKCRYVMKRTKKTTICVLSVLMTDLG